MATQVVAEPVPNALEQQNDSSDLLPEEEVGKHEIEEEEEMTVDQDGDGSENQEKEDDEDVVKFDTSHEYAQIFGEAPAFDSWDEFTKSLEQFQLRTKTSFKPRSACSIDYANERRIKCPIPERFVYANVKMICFHYGTWSKRGSGQKRDYVGKGCNAFMNVGFNRGALRITQKNLIHSNHVQVVETEQTPQRSLRIFSFTEESDMSILKEVLRLNPYGYANGEKQWIKAVDNLKNDDEMFNDLTPRLIKKRVRFLIDKFLAITHGRRPPKEDEMGILLYELHKAKKDAIDGVLSQEKKKGKRGRPKKRPLSEDEVEEEDGMISDEASGPVSKFAPLKSTSSPSKTSTSDITQLLSYLEKKDEEEKRFRQRQWEDDRRIRLREIEIRKEELSFQKERFEFEKMERKAHIDVLKSQLQAFEQSLISKQANTIASTKDGVTEYTIVVDNNNQVLQSLPTIG